MTVHCFLLVKIKKVRDMFTRRIFLVSTVGAAVAATPIAQASASNPTPIVVTSWDFAAGANNVAWPILDKGGSAIDAVEAGINYVELLADESWVATFNAFIFTLLCELGTDWIKVCLADSQTDPIPKIGVCGVNSGDCPFVPELSWP